MWDALVTTRPDSRNRVDDFPDKLQAYNSAVDSAVDPEPYLTSSQQAW